jgi:hypothetical protein
MKPLINIHYLIKDILKGELMDDMQILKQLLNGHHLNRDELLRAKTLIHVLNIELEDRLKQIIV